VNARSKLFARLGKVEMWVVGVAWVLIVIKSFFVYWAVPHYHIPFSPLWIVGPTIVFAAVATTIWLVHRED